MKFVTKQMGPMIQRFQTVCDKCQGTGDLIDPKDRCKKCNGKNRVGKKDFGSSCETWYEGWRSYYICWRR